MKITLYGGPLDGLEREVPEFDHPPLDEKSKVFPVGEELILGWESPLGVREVKYRVTMTFRPSAAAPNRVPFARGEIVRR